MARPSQVARGELGEVAEEGRRLVLRRSRLVDAPASPELDRWTSRLREDTNAALAAFALADGSGLVVKSAVTAEGPLAVSLRAGDAELLRDALLRLAPGLATAGGGAYLAAEVHVDGQLLGVLSLVDGARSTWSGRGTRSLDYAAAAVANELALRLAKEETRRMQELVASHNEAHDLIARAAPLEEVLTFIARSIERYDPSLIPCVVLLDSSSSTLHPGAGPSLPPDYLAAIDGVVIGPSIGTCGTAAWSGQLTITEDIETDPKWAPVRGLAAQAGLRHCWSMPIKAPGGEVLGTLAFYGTRPRWPLPEHLALLQDWARVAGIAIERHQALEKLIHDARHDGLTGLPNRRAILEKLEEAIQRAEVTSQAAVLFVDLDSLKQLNDTLGHDGADDMLREVGARLAAAVPPGTFVGRFGGDEFVVIAEGLSGADDAAAIGEELLRAVAQPLPCPVPMVITASIGVALVTGNAVDAREVLRESDSAMYSAKRAGRDRCAFFEGGQRIHTGRRLLLARGLRGVEQRGELHLAFQPIYRLPDLELVGVEALLRWDGPTVGPVPPAEFIPIAEDTGAIVPIGAWVLREACETLARLSAEIGRPLELSVNVSHRQLARPGFVQSVRQTLSHAQLPVERLSLEIAGTALVRPHALASRALVELDAAGVRIVLDDFGTGFSSLSWVKQYPVGGIKIDRSLVGGLPGDGRDHAVVAAVLEMAKGIGCTVTAEGVETVEQLDVVKGLGCELVQGFLLAPPSPFEQLLERPEFRPSEGITSLSQGVARPGSADAPPPRSLAVGAPG